MKRMDIILIGLGNIGRPFLQILQEKEAILAQSYGLQVRVVAVADSRGAALNPEGFPLGEIVAWKEAGRSVGELPEVGQPGVKALVLAREVPAHLLVEATPTNLQHGEPGLSCIRAALERGLHVVTANKGPLVLAYEELTALARSRGVHLRFCGTVAGGLPALNIGRRDLAGATVFHLESCPNLVANYILSQVLEGVSFDDAVEAARRDGRLEADPSLDLEGWDAAEKLLILCNDVLRFPATLKDVQVEGITRVTREELLSAQEAGEAIRLVAEARRLPDGTYDLQVGPRRLPADHTLARLRQKELAVIYHTDLYGTVTATIHAPTGPPSATASVLRDILDIHERQEGH